MLIGASLLFLCVAFFFVNNMTLMLMPEKWLSLLANNPYGLNLNTDAQQVIPRYLHFVLAAFAVTGLTMGCFGLYWLNREPDYGKWLVSKGAAMYLIITLAQIGVGTWFLLSLPHEIMMNYLGRDSLGTAVFIAAMIVDIFTLAAMFLAWREGSGGPFKLALAGALFTILLMVYMRHLLRVYTVQPFFDPAMVPVETQWGVIALLLFSFLLLGVYLAWLLKVTWQAYHPTQPTDA